MRSWRDLRISLLVTLALLLGAELGLRLFFHEQLYGTAEREILYDPHPKMLFTPRPGVSGTYVRAAINGGDSIPWHINAQGFRGGPAAPATEVPSASSPDTTRRIMVFGDSNIQARFTRLENTYAARLSHYLPATEVINAGVISYGPDQSLFRMQETLPLYQPDLVIFHVFADNDYGDILRNMLVGIDPSGKLTLTGTGALVPELEGLRSGESRGSGKIRGSRENGDSLSRWNSAKNRAWSSLALRRATAKIAKKIVGEPSAEDWMQIYERWSRDEYEAYLALDTARTGSGDDYDIDLATLCDPEAATLKIRLMEAILTEAHAFARSHKAEFLLLVQPSAIDLTSGNFYLDRQTLEANHPNYDPRRLCNSIVDICKERDIPCLDLWEGFSANGPDSLYFRAPNNHWNDRGQDLAAELTAKSNLIEALFTPVGQGNLQ